jgi:predicted phosphodiesterase
MRVALFSDLHGHITGLRAVLARLDQLGGADLTYALGDFVGGGPGAEDLLDLLLERQVGMVRGNWDEIFIDLGAQLRRLAPASHATVLRTYEWLLRQLAPAYRQLLAQLPLTASIQLAADHQLLLCHAAPDDPWARTCRADTPLTVLQQTYSRSPAQIIAYGHYHASHMLPLGKQLLLNVASVGLGWEGLSSLTLLTYADGHLSIQQQQVPYDVTEHQQLVYERGMPPDPAIWYW